MTKLINILNKIKLNQELSAEEIQILLQVQGEEQEQLFNLAEGIRREQAGNKVYLRAVIDVSNFCRCRCTFCGNSAGSSKITRYRMTKEDILKAVEHGHRLGIDVVHLASGEDPKLNLSDLTEVITKIVSLGMEPEVVLGKLPEEYYQELYQLGARRTIMKFETSDPWLYQREKKCGRTIHMTVEFLKKVKQMGFHIGSGNIVGLPGQSIESLVGDILLLKELNVDMASTAAFIPNQDSEHRDAPVGDRNVALNLLALYRLLLPSKKLCISSNSTLGQEGKLRALQVGANLLSVNLTPSEYSGKYSIYSGQDRYKADYDATLEFIEQAGMVLSTYKEMFQDGSS